MLRLAKTSRTSFSTLAAGSSAAAPLVAGGLAATGFAPLGLWPLTLAALAWLIQRIGTVRSGRQAFFTGWLFGVGHFSVGNGWIATAFTYQAEMPQWLGWIAVVLLALYLAVYPALGVLAGWWLARRWRAALVPAFAACWIVSEWLRAWAFTAQPLPSRIGPRLRRRSLNQASSMAGPEMAIEGLGVVVSQPLSRHQIIPFPARSASCV